MARSKSRKSDPLPLLNILENQAPQASSDEEVPSLGLRALDHAYEPYTSAPSEIVIGLVGPLGTDNAKIRSMIRDRLFAYGYESDEIRISQIIPVLAGNPKIPKSPQYEYSKKLIDLGNAIRKETNNNAVLAIAAAAEIARRRPDPKGEVTKRAYIISSLKNPQEVEELRKIYGNGFYLFAIHSERDRRAQQLSNSGTGMDLDLAWKLILRDEDEQYPYGQHMVDTFHLADFFVADENNDDKLRQSIIRCLDLAFSNPFITPTFNEFAMFMAFASSLRSADLSRQVGAVVTRKSEILSTGANDCPRAGGGLYWPLFIGDRVDDEPRGRDYKRGFDSNAAEKSKLIGKILERFSNNEERKRAEKILKSSPIKHITEYGRMVHAEMEALLACARNNISSVGATLYCTTFPCHNCAKHIIAAGIKEVIYVEPYSKSKALEFHEDAVTSEKQEGDTRVRFKPFIGVGPRQFFNLFSLSLSAGIKMDRKNDDGSVVIWNESKARPRVQLLPVAHRDFEDEARDYLKELLKKREEIA
jgi:deoxycytidylate deaminase